MTRPDITRDQFKTELARFQNNVFSAHVNNRLDALFDSELDSGANITKEDTRVSVVFPSFPYATFSWSPGGPWAMSSIPLVYLGMKDKMVVTATFTVRPKDGPWRADGHRGTRIAMNKFLGLVLSHSAHLSSTPSATVAQGDTPDKETPMEAQSKRETYDPSSAPQVQLPELDTPIRQLEYGKMMRSQLLYDGFRSNLKQMCAVNDMWAGGTVRIDAYRKLFAVARFRCEGFRAGIQSDLDKQGGVKTIVKDGWRKEVSVPKEPSATVVSMDKSFAKQCERYRDYLTEAGIVTAEEHGEQAKADAESITATGTHKHVVPVAEDKQVNGKPRRMTL